MCPPSGAHHGTGTRVGGIAMIARAEVAIAIAIAIVIAVEGPARGPHP